MKKYILIIACFLFHHTICESQNWSPITPQEKFNYQVDNATYISNTLWVDSIEVINADTVFHLNKIVADCFECPWQFDKYTEYKLANQSQFMQHTITNKGEGIYEFSGNKHFILETKSQLGASWNFDSLNNITATIVDLSELALFGAMDSVKVIETSNGDSIWLSKNHGIVQFNEGDLTYELKGIEERGIGEHVPNFWDIYNFDVGDVFQYKHTEGGFDGVDFWEYTTLEKYTILSKTVEADKYIYETFRVYTGSNNGTSDHSIEFIQSSNDAAYTEFYNRSLVNYVDIDNYELCGPPKSFMGIYKDSIDQRVIKKTGNPFNYEYDKLVSYDFQDYDFQSQIPISDTLIRESCSHFFYHEYKEGVGLVFSRISGFEWGKDSELLGYVKGTDTIGTVWSDEEILLSTQNVIEHQHSFQLYPNPISNGILNMKSIPSQALSIKIFDLNGKMVLNHFDFISDAEIDLSHLSAGIYFVRISNNEIVETRKIIVL